VTPTAESNLQTFDAPHVASHYASLSYLSPCEQLLFESYVKPGSSILDLGVGGGRTTGWLARRASKYLGVDNAPAMVQACRVKFPELKFVVADASNLSSIEDESFDVAVFAFNGLDYVLPAASRRACIQNIYRVLQPNGVVIFSSHNPRACMLPRGWNRTRLLQAARAFSAGSQFVHEFLLLVLTVSRCAWAVCQSSGATLLRSRRRILSRAFWRGEGDLVDPEHGGLLTHCWTPRRVIDELYSLGFRVERVLGDDYPRKSGAYSTDWYYYVFKKSQTQVSASCA
jgi:SAM-dependent methyltransferase